MKSPRASIFERTPIFLVAEIGVNHNGKLDLAIQMIKEAKRAGADAVKFQTFKAERVASVSAPKALYQLEVTDRSESQLDMLRRLELSPDHYQELISICETEGVDFLSTPYSAEDAALLADLNVRAFKVASAMIVETPFLDSLARYGRPIILSTGMSTLAEVDRAVRTIREAGNEQIVLLQCTTDYPTQPDMVNLRAMQTMANAFGLPVGFSDHTQTNTASVMAVALGASVIEKHFTLDKSLPGPDQACSADPAEFAELVKNIREAEAVLGSALKQPVPAELRNLREMRRSLVAVERVRAGTTIKADMVNCKRPAAGIAPSDLDAVIGCRAVTDIEPDQTLQWWMLARSPDNQT